jgi:hypothetical protein
MARQSPLAAPPAAIPRPPPKGRHPPAKRRHRGRALAALAGLGLLAGCIGDANSNPLSGQPPSAVLSAALATLMAGGTAHIGISATTPEGSITCSIEATVSGGWQVIIADTGERMVIMLINGVGYAAGNASGLEAFMQVPGSQARSNAGHWIAVRPGQQVGEQAYRNIVDGITLPAVVSEVTPTGPLTLTAPTVVAGQPAIGVQGLVPRGQHFPSTARATLYVAINGTRPLLFEVSGANGYQDQVTFSNWGSSVQLVAPPHAIPAEALQAPVLTAAARPYSLDFHTERLRSPAALTPSGSGQLPSFGH